MPEWKTLGIDEASGRVVTPNGSVGFRWGQSDGKWNLEPKEAAGAPVSLALSLIDRRDAVCDNVELRYSEYHSGCELLRKTPLHLSPVTWWTYAL